MLQLALLYDSALPMHEQNIRLNKLTYLDCHISAPCDRQKVYSWTGKFV